MPEIKAVQVEVNTGWGDHYLKAGDYINDKDTDLEGPVTNVDVKTKWAFITVDGHRRKVERATLVWVEREFATPQEEAAKEDAYNVKRVKRFIEDYPVSAVKARVVELSKDIGASHWRFNLDRAAGILLDQYKSMYMQEIVLRYDQNTLCQKVQDDDARWLMAAAIQVRLTSDWLVAEYRHRALSRSTSVISNLEDDIQREAAAWFIHQFEYMGMEKYLPNTEEK